MKLDPALLFIGTFIIDACPWCVYAFWLVRSLSYRIGGLFRGIKPERVKPWKRGSIENMRDPEAKFLAQQAMKWLKICFATWGISFVLLIVLVFSLDRLGWLGNS